MKKKNSSLLWEYRLTPDGGFRLAVVSSKFLDDLEAEFETNTDPLTPEQQRLVDEAGLRGNFRKPKKRGKGDKEK